MTIPEAEVRVGDIGTLFVLTFYDETGAIINLATNTSLQFFFSKPSGTVLTKTASLLTDGSDGKAKYASINGDLDTPGTWELQGRVSFLNGTWGSTRTRFSVEGNLF